MQQNNTSHSNVFVTPFLEEKAKSSPAYAQFLLDIQKLVEHFKGFEAHVIGGEPE